MFVHDDHRRLVHTITATYGTARASKAESKTISGSTDAKLGGSINPENVYMPLRGLNVEAGDWPDVVPGGLAWPLWQPGPAGRGAMPLTPAQVEHWRSAGFVALRGLWLGLRVGGCAGWRGPLCAAAG